MRNEFSELLNWFYICQDVTSGRGERGGGPSSQLPGPRCYTLYSIRSYVASCKASSILASQHCSSVPLAAAAVRVLHVTTVV